MKTEYDFTRLTVAEPAPVVDSDPHGKRWIGLMVLATAGIAALCLTHTQRLPGPLPAETWPEAGPSSVFGVSQCPELEKCQMPKLVDSGFLSRFVGALDEQAANPREIRDVLARSYTETRLTPSTVSATGDWGICGINVASWPEYDGFRLLDDPEYAAGACLAVYRVYREKCGDDWQCCYRYGVVGCRKDGGK